MQEVGGVRWWAWFEVVVVGGGWLEGDGGWWRVVTRLRPLVVVTASTSVLHFDDTCVERENETKFLTICKTAPTHPHTPTWTTPFCCCSTHTHTHPPTTQTPVLTTPTTHTPTHTHHTHIQYTFTTPTYIATPILPHPHCHTHNATPTSVLPLGMLSTVGNCVGRGWNCAETEEICAGVSVLNIFKGK